MSGLLARIREDRELFLAMVFLGLGLPPLKLYVFSWLAWIFLFQVFEKSDSAMKPFCAKFLLLGGVYFGSMLFWVMDYAIATFLMLVAMSAPFFALYFLGLFFLTRKAEPGMLCVGLAMSWWLVFLSWLRFLPVGTIFFEVPFYAPIRVLRVIAFTGFPVFSALIVGIAYAICLGWRYHLKRLRVLALSLVLLLGAGILYVPMMKKTSLQSPTMRVALIQHNLPYNLEWRLSHAATIFQTYARLAARATGENPTLLIFPLYTLPDSFREHPSPYLEIAQLNQKPILLATHLLLDDTIPLADAEGAHYRNVALLLGIEGRILDFYQTVSAPFFITEEKTALEAKVLSLDGKTFGVLLCSEDARPHLVRDAVFRGAEFLIAMSNPGQFRSDSLTYFHLMQDQLRALESGRAVVRVSAQGPTALIMPDGLIQKKLKIGHEGILAVDVPLRRGRTFFYRFGFLWESIAGFFLIIFLLFSGRLQMTPKMAAMKFRS